jgi:hypothetical protein
MKKTLSFTLLLYTCITFSLHAQINTVDPTNEWVVLEENYIIQSNRLLTYRFSYDTHEIDDKDYREVVYFSNDEPDNIIKTGSLMRQEDRTVYYLLNDNSELAVDFSASVGDTIFENHMGYQTERWVVAQKEEVVYLDGVSRAKLTVRCVIETPYDDDDEYREEVEFVEGVLCTDFILMNSFFAIHSCGLYDPFFIGLRLLCYFEDGMLVYTHNDEGSCNLSTTENQASMPLSVFPNPATDQISINYHTDIDRVEVFNMDQKRVITERVQLDRVTLNISYLIPGMYYVRATDANGSSHVGRFVKQ